MALVLKVDCRACNRACGEFKHLLEETIVGDEVKTFAALLNYCTTLDAFCENHESGMPQNICNSCVEHLFQSYTFKKMVLQNETAYRERLQAQGKSNKDEMVLLVKEEQVVKEEIDIEETMETEEFLSENEEVVAGNNVKTEYNGQEWVQIDKNYQSSVCVSNNKRSERQKNEFLENVSIDNVGNSNDIFVINEADAENYEYVNASDGKKYDSWDNDDKDDDIIFVEEQREENSNENKDKAKRKYTKTLHHVFKHNPIYNELRSYYDKYGQLGSAEQNKLSRTIIDFYIAKNYKMDSRNLQILASQIVTLFPNEAQEVYFEKQKNQRAKGKLFFRYQNMLKPNAKPNKKSEKQFTEKNISLLANADELQTKHFLKYNFADKEKTCQRWKQCINCRLKEFAECADANIANIIDSWPAYKQSFGADLISIDFEGLYPEKSNKFFLNWTKLNIILPTYLNMNLKDAKMKSVWVEAKEKWSSLDQNTKDALFIFLLHGILKPERISKEVGKATIAESQMATIKFVEAEIQLNLYTGHSPFLLIKKSLFVVEEIFVVVDQIMYKVDTVAAALALCFKIHQIFYIKYNTKCKNFWLFVQTILFDITLKGDNAGNSLRSLSSFFESQN